MEKDRKRKAAIRADSRARLESTPLPSEAKKPALSSPILSKVSPIDSPPTSVHLTPAQVPHASDSDIIAQLEDKMDRKCELIAKSVLDLGTSFREFVTKSSEVKSASVVSEEAAVRPSTSPRPRSLSRSPAPGRRHTVSRREAGGVYPRAAVDSVVNFDSITVKRHHWKGVDVSGVSLSSDSEVCSPDTRRKKWGKVSRPLKRRAVPLDSSSSSVKRGREKSPQPSCSCWENPVYLSPSRSSGAVRKRSREVSVSDLHSFVLPTETRKVSTRSPADERENLTHKSSSRKSFPSPAPSGDDANNKEAFLDPLRQLQDLVKSLKKVKACTDEEAKQSTTSDGEDQSEQESKVASAYSNLMKFLLASYPEFEPAPPFSPPSTFVKDRKVLSASLPKLVLLQSAKRVFKEAEKWLEKKRESGKAAFAVPPSKLLKTYKFYATGELPSLGVAASSQGDFSGLVDANRRTAFSSAKIFFSSPDFDHLIKNLFKVIEVFSFLDWTIAALARKIEDCRSLEDSLTTDWLDILSCADKAVRDGSGELASLLTLGVLKKRELWCSFTSKEVTSNQKSALTFAPLCKSHLFPEQVIQQVLSDLEKKSTNDLLTRSSTRRPKETTPTGAKGSPLQKHPFRGGKTRWQPRPRTNLRPQATASKKPPSRQSDK